MKGKKYTSMLVYSGLDSSDYIIVNLTTKKKVQQNQRKEGHSSHPTRHNHYSGINSNLPCMWMLLLWIISCVVEGPSPGEYPMFFDDWGRYDIVELGEEAPYSPGLPALSSSLIWVWGIIAAVLDDDERIEDTHPFTFPKFALLDWGADNPL